MTKKAALHNLGCKVNAYELEAMQQMLEQAGYEIVPFAPGADVYVINTCTVTNIADRKSRQMLHKAKKMNPDAVVVACGCYVQAAGEALKKDEAIDIVIGNNKKQNLLEILAAYWEEQQDADVNIIDINHTKEYEELKIEKTAEHTRAYMKIQDGCNQFCTYCIIPYARGRVRSRRPEAVLEELHKLADAGYKEVVLTGIHLSSYGTDFEKHNQNDENKGTMGTEVSMKTETVTQKDAASVKENYPYGTALLELLEQIEQIHGIERVRLGSLEPGIVTEAFVKRLASCTKICPHFHLSMQSGCDATLKRMNRRYDTAQFAQRCEILRNYFPHVALTTDIIVGFPGETEEEFAQTRAYVEQIHFYETHIFKYSRRQGTKAAVMEHQIPDAVKTERSQILIDLGHQHKMAFAEHFLDQEVEVLFEEAVEKDGISYWQGHTRHYVCARMEADTDLTNVCKVCKVMSIDQDGILHCAEKRDAAL